MARANTSSAYQDDYYTYSKEQQPKKKKIVNEKGFMLHVKRDY